MDMPWKKIAPVNPNGEYLALLTYLPLKKHRTIPRFFWSTFAIQKQLAGSAGILGYALRARPLEKNFWTMSAWLDEKCLMDFALRIPHSQVMKVLAPLMSSTKFIRWKVAGSDVPLRWSVALERAKREAQP
ncbi:MAG: hypothetical protein HRJ53_16010 [Acidobacteria bacterium Pan2503]|uniref:DUF3291 domain-containing protein n=1 Tax=Candidatus Acidiferrum panamense TaxID=2741543 RepID=A0A7V8NSL8_9BACT|nr:hypothetical protein [Candidatus Acidoferrum panamensis]